MKFADTSWWVAWALPGDSRHDDAVAMLGRIGRAEQVLTTNLIVGETWTFLRRKDRHASAVAFLGRVDRLTSEDRLVLHRVTDEQEVAAWDWLRKHDERVYSFADATSFRAMRDRRLREALAFDLDFAAAGFTERRTVDLSREGADDDLQHPVPFQNFKNPVGSVRNRFRHARPSSGAGGRDSRRGERARGDLRSAAPGSSSGAGR